MTDRDWQALHIFYGGSLDALLLDTLLPALERLKAKGRLSRFFFLRYWNGGPHIRLRVPAAEGPSVVFELKPELEEWMAAHPGGVFDPGEYERAATQMDRVRLRLRPEERALVEPVEPLVRRADIQIRGYEFDEQRYGNLSVRDFVEDHFCWSSAFASRLLAGTAVEPGSRSALSLYLTAATYQATTLSTSDAARLFRNLSQWGLRLNQTEAVANLQDAHGLPDCTSEAAALGPLRQQLLEGLPCAAHAPWINAVLMLWAQAGTGLFRAAEPLHATGSLRLEPVALLMDALHLLNNRLGVFTGVESYVNHLLAEVLRNVEIDTTIEPPGVTP